ncbi:MAG: beta-ketoacyl synthase N-terminal-like domain-containing protein, partial [Zavarzinia sp.]|nr:beta-ketoacyl synthase N-terminal-like domain-containing protein [Zavarzinia sp.]
MREAVIVSTARTPIAKAFRGAFNNTHGATLGGHVIQHAVARAGLEGGEIDDVYMGVGLPEGAAGHNVARNAAIRAGLPVTVAGATLNRFCSSGLNAIALAAQQIMAGNADIMVGGGLESISLVQNNLNVNHFTEDWLMEHKPSLWMPMLDTADLVGERYNVSRDVQDEYALSSQQRTGAAQAAGAFDAEIVPLKTVMKVMDKATGQISDVETELLKDEG